MSISPFWESIHFFQKDPNQAVLAYMKGVPVFSSIPDRGLKTIRNYCYIRRYKEGEHIFRYGEPGVGMYIVLEGRVEIYHRNRNHQGDLRFAELGEGDFFGELALLEDQPRSASARAMQYCKLLGFFRPDLMMLITRKPSLSGIILLNIARLIGRRLIHTNDQLEKQTRFDGIDTDPSSEKVPEE